MGHHTLQHGGTHPSLLSPEHYGLQTFVSQPLLKCSLIWDTISNASVTPSVHTFSHQDHSLILSCSRTYEAPTLCKALY